MPGVAEGVAVGDVLVVAVAGVAVAVDDGEGLVAARVVESICFAGWDDCGGFGPPGIGVGQKMIRP